MGHKHIDSRETNDALYRVAWSLNKIFGCYCAHSHTRYSRWNTCLCFFLLFVFTWMFVGCQSSHTVGEVLEELRHEKYVQSIDVGNHRLEFRLVPEPLYYLSRSGLDSNTIFSKALLDSLKKDMGEGQLSGTQSGIRFSMVLAPRQVDSTKGLNFQNDVVYGTLSGKGYSETLQRYLFGLKKNIWLEVDGKRYDLQNYHMVRSWGLTRSRSFVLLFPDLGVENLKSVTLVTESIVPGQGRNKLTWELPVSKHQFVKG